MTANELRVKLGALVPVDVIRTKTGGLRVITNYDIELYKLGVGPDPYNC